MREIELIILDCKRNEGAFDCRIRYPYSWAVGQFGREGKGLITYRKDQVQSVHRSQAINWDGNYRTSEIKHIIHKSEIMLVCRESSKSTLKYLLRELVILVRWLIMVKRKIVMKQNLLGHLVVGESEKNCWLMNFQHTLNVDIKTYLLI